VAGIVAGSPAEAAGISIGDTIVGVDGTTVTSPSSLTSTLSSHHPGDTVRVSWVDGLGRRHTASIRLVGAPA
jgi:S1-C subfamily serine protease